MPRPPVDDAIEIEHLTRTFRGRHGAVTRAVDDLSLTVGRGELVGLLGPNGAGKTSTVKVLMTVLLPSSGTARILGRDVVADAQAVRRSVGVILGGDAGLYPRLSGRNNLLLFADLYGIPHRQQKSRVSELLDTVGLAEPNSNGSRVLAGHEAAPAHRPGPAARSRRRDHGRAQQRHRSGRRPELRELIRGWVRRVAPCC